MKKIFCIFLIILCLVGCGRTDLPNTEINTQQSEFDTESNVDSETESETEKIVYTYTEMDMVVYTTTTLNVRDLPSTEGEKIGGLAKDQEVLVTGQCNETGWYRIKYGDEVGYVSNAYTTKEKPVVDNSSWVKNLKEAQNTTQMIVVVANANDNTYATVSMHTKDANGVWVENFSVNGRLGWGGIGKQIKGDGKTPIGVYYFMEAFGIKDDPGVTALPYVKVDDSHHWVGDQDSKYYNQLVSTKDVEVEWKSSEHLIDYVPSYNYCLALSYNDARLPEIGSAIFLHCPNYSFGPTAGCIAIPEENMIQAMRLLQKDCVIIIDNPENIWNY